MFGLYVIELSKAVGGMSAGEAWDLYDFIWGIAFGAVTVGLAFVIAVMITSVIRHELRMRRRSRDTGN